MTDHKSAKKVDVAAQSAAQQQIDGQPEFEMEQAVPGAAVQRATLNARRTTPRDILQLQRAIGNRAVASMTHPQRSQSATGPFVQARLMVGPADDRYEREADSIADQVMRMPVPASKALKRGEDHAHLGVGGKIQRMSTIQRADAAGTAGFETDQNFQRGLNASKSQGRALPKATRSFMEQRFQRSFDNVRVHTGASAVQLSRDIQAKAFTHGSHIYFNSGAYAPGTDAGKHLLAHELTHVVQQTGGVQRKQSGIIQRAGLFSRLKSAFSKKKPKEASAVSGSKNLKDTSSSIPKDASQPTPDPSRDDSVAYERALGRYAFNHPRANAAAKTVMDKMTSVMIQDFDDKNSEHQKQLIALYGRDKADSAGQVGTDIKAVLGVLKEGNLRERMTALMNAMFGPFKQYIQELFNKSAWTEAQDKGLDATKLKRRKRQKYWNPLAVDIFRDPGNPLDRKNLSTWQRTGKTRTKADKTSDRTVADLDDEDIGLSERELALQFPNQSADEVEDEKLKWMEGGTYWAVNHKNKWVKKVENSLHMPVIAGPSGTMLRMFQTWEFLNKPVSAADWRLAVMGWMLTSNDHSFHEMMLTSADYGLPYTPGQLAYMNVDPISLMELRQHVAVDGLFPHEHALQRQLEGGNVKHLMKESDASIGQTKLDKMKGSEKGALSSLGAAAIKLYSQGGYLTLNPARKGGLGAKAKIWWNLKKKDEMSDLKDDYDDGDLSISDLMQEASAIMPVLDSALDMLPDWSGDLYRGTGTFSPFSYGLGSKIRFGAYTSSTLDLSTAEDFAVNYNKGPFKYILHLKTTAGKDIRKLAAYAEDEILIPPGSEFTVTKRTKPKSGLRFYEVFMDQTKRGGMGTKLMPEDDTLIEKTDDKKPETESQEKSGYLADFTPTLSELKVYDSSEYQVDTIDAASYITDPTVGSAGIGDDGVTFWVEVSTKGGLYWVKADELQAFTGYSHPEWLKHKQKNSTDVSSSPSVESVSSESSSEDQVKKAPLQLYVDGSGDKNLPVHTLENTSTIQDPDASYYKDNEGVEWNQISTTEGELYWVKTNELKAFMS